MLGRGWVFGCEEQARSTCFLERSHTTFTQRADKRGTASVVRPTHPCPLQHAVAEVVVAPLARPVLVHLCLYDNGLEREG